jgi:hypothetical protein
MSKERYLAEALLGFVVAVERARIYCDGQCRGYGGCAATAIGGCPIATSAALSARLLAAKYVFGFDK